MEINPKRTGVKAREIPKWPQPMTEDAKHFGEPGDMIRELRHNASEVLWGFNFSCPGCGKFLAIPLFPIQGTKWVVTAGSVDDVTTLTLSPSIHCIGCCGWHGWLQKGIFNSV